MGRPPKAGRLPANDEDTSAIIYQGATVTQLARLFRQREETIRGKLAGRLAPCGQRGRYDIYRVDEAAGYLVKPNFDIEEHIKRMNHADLPKTLTKEYWAGLRSKQEYELREGDLWPTAKIIEEVGELFKLIKMSVRLAIDGVERRVELTEVQRGIINNQMDGLLLDLHKRITETFGGQQRVVQEEADDEEI